MQNKIRVGIIGAGFGAIVHAPMMNIHAGFEVVALSSVRLGRKVNIEKDTSIENIYDNWREMLHKEDLDMVSVVSAPGLHHEMVIEAFQKGCHVLCEKPMAMNVEQTYDMRTRSCKTVRDDKF